MKKKKEYVSTKTVVGIGVLALIFFSVAGAIIFHPSNVSGTSLMDTDVSDSQEHQGIISPAWVVTAIFSGIVLLICSIYLVRKRGFFE